VASFKEFSENFVSAVTTARPSDGYQEKISDGYTIDVKKTDSLFSPVVGTLEGELDTYVDGRKVSDVSVIGNESVRFSTAVRCSFAARGGKWQLAHPSHDTSRTSPGEPGNAI
jgi:hypothetical protein